MKKKIQAWMVLDSENPQWSYEKTTRMTRSASIAAFLHTYGDILEKTWKGLYKVGYRCVRCTIEYEVPE